MKNILTLLAFLSFGIIYAQDGCLLNEPAPKRLVVDLADILSPSTEKKLENSLIKFSNETSNQILVVTVNDLCGMDKAQFSYTLGENWKVGQKEFDNGIVLMVKPFGKKGDRHTFIAVGRGLEGAIPDAIAKRIVINELIPHFKQNDFEGGIISGVQVLMGFAKGEINIEQYQKKGKGFPLFSLLFIILIIFFIFFSNVRRVQQNSVGKNLSFWAAIWLLSSTGHRSGGGWNSFHSGGGSFGGGGGFGGFGGGGFGGGGAGGSW